MRIFRPTSLRGATWLATSALALIITSGCRDNTEGVAEIVLSGSLDDLDGSASSRHHPSSLRGILQLLLEASRDDELSGILVRIGNLEGGSARIFEVRDALQRLRESGRLVHCHLVDTSNYTSWLAASACEHVSISPGGSMFLVGLATESYYLRDLLENLGVEGDFLQMGSHKGAAEVLTLDDMSPESRETMDALLDDLTEDLIEGISAGRSLEPTAVRDLIDQGPFGAQQALDSGIVDAVAYRDQALSNLQEAIPGEAPILERYRARRSSQESSEALELLLQGPDRPPTGPRIAVLYLSGAIGGSPVGGGLFGDQISLGQVRRATEAIREEEDIRAVVVRIESPGGSASISDEIWHEIMRLREERPVVASMGDVAASGGYYIAAAASEIFAQPGTITGSIGVVGGKVVFDDAFERIGIRPVLLGRGRNSGLTSLARPFTPSQRRALEQHMEATYELFIQRIVEGRSMDEALVRELATGRVWSGRRALELGLVDSIGGLHDAIESARELGELEHDAPVEAFPKPLSLVEQVEQAMNTPGLSVSSQQFVQVIPGSSEAPVSHALTFALLISEYPVLTYWPVATDIR